MSVDMMGGNIIQHGPHRYPVGFPHSTLAVPKCVLLRAQR